MENLALFALAGTLVFFIGGFWLQRRNIIKNGEFTNATVIKTIKRRGRRGSSHFPVLGYTVDGREYEVEYNVGNMFPKYIDGETVKIVYHKQKAERVVIVN